MVLGRGATPPPQRHRRGARGPTDRGHTAALSADRARDSRDDAHATDEDARGVCDPTLKEGPMEDLTKAELQAVSSWGAAIIKMAKLAEMVADLQDDTRLKQEV